MKDREYMKGIFVSDNKIRVESFEKQLKNGQRVLVCRPTEKKIIDYTNGKVIGVKENVVGTGIVKLVDGAIHVELSKDDVETHYRNILKERYKRRRKAEKLARLYGIKHRKKSKNNYVVVSHPLEKRTVDFYGSGKDFIIKPIEE